MAYLGANHISKIVNAYRNAKDVNGFCKVLDKQALLDNNADLSIQKYVFLDGTDYSSILSLEESVNLWTESILVKNENVIDLVKMICDEI